MFCTTVYENLWLHTKSSLMNLCIVTTQAFNKFYVSGKNTFELHEVTNVCIPLNLFNPNNKMIALIWSDQVKNDRRIEDLCVTDVSA